MAGESYGTTRAAGLAGHLLNRHGISLNGLVLISSILNFQTAGFDSKTWTFERGNDLPYTVFLPTYAAAAWYHERLDERFQGRPLPEFLAEVEEFAATDYALALFQGDSLEPARFDEIAGRVAAYTGLPVDYVKAYRLRIEILRFCKQLLRAEKRTIGRIDARYKGIDRFPDGDAIENDPSLDATMGLYTSALNDYVRQELGYESELPYEVLSYKVNEAWDYDDFKNAHVDVSETLRETMSRNPFMRVFVANGYYDLATPHFATEYTFAHLGLEESLRAERPDELLRGRAHDVRPRRVAAPARRRAAQLHRRGRSAAARQPPPSSTTRGAVVGRDREHRRDQHGRGAVAPRRARARRADSRSATRSAPGSSSASRAAAGPKTIVRLRLAARERARRRRAARAPQPWRGRGRRRRRLAARDEHDRAVGEELERGARLRGRPAIESS